MFVEIRSETSLTWEIDYEDGGGKQSALLKMDGGSWYLFTNHPKNGYKNIAGPRIEWPEALKRALIALSPKAT
jgi:hypothetical protein